MNYLSHEIADAWEVRHFNIVFLNVKGVSIIILLILDFLFFNVSFVPVVNFVWNFIDIEQAFHQHEF
jgi:hypothetical protein